MPSGCWYNGMKGKFSKKIVVFSISIVVIYTITAIVYQFVARDALDATLTGCVYGFFGGELLAMAGIKIASKKGEE